VHEREELGFVWLLEEGISSRLMLLKNRTVSAEFKDRNHERSQDRAEQCAYLLADPWVAHAEDGLRDIS
jgi:hypothetical protein